MTRTLFGLCFNTDEKSLEKIIQKMLDYHATLKGHVANEFMCDFVLDGVTFSIYGIIQEGRLSLAHLGATYELHYDGSSFKCCDSVHVELEEVHGVVHGTSRENFISNVAERLRDEVRDVKERYGV